METTEQLNFNLAEINKKKIEDEIARLKSFINNETGKKNYREFWELSHYLNSMFKLLKPIQDRENLIKEFAELRDATKLQETADREVRRKESAEKRKNLESQLEEINSLIASAKDYAELDKTRELLQQPLAVLRGGSASENGQEKSNTADDVLVREDKDALWEIWRNANEAVKQKRISLEEVIFQKIKADILEIQKEAETGNPHEALRKIKEVQSDPATYKFSKNFREELKASLNAAFEIAIKKIKNIRDENKRKRQEWVSRMDSNVARWTELLEKNLTIISGLEAQINKLQEDIANAKTPEFAERIKSWIDEKTNKIEDIKQTNLKLEEKIGSVRKNLGKSAADAQSEQTAESAEQAAETPAEEPIQQAAAETESASASQPE